MIFDYKRLIVQFGLKTGVSTYLYRLRELNFLVGKSHVLIISRTLKQHLLSAAIVDYLPAVTISDFIEAVNLLFNIGSRLHFDNSF